MTKTVTCPPRSITIWKDHDLLGEWMAIIPETHTYEQVKNPSYFGLVSGLRPLDRIKVTSADCLWAAEFIVSAVQKNISQVSLEEWIPKKEFKVKPFPQGYSCEYRGDKIKNCIIRNGEVVEGGFLTKNAARMRAMIIAGVSDVDEDTFEAQENGGKSDERITLEAEADRLGIPYRADIKDAGLKKKIDEFKLAEV